MALKNLFDMVKADRYTQDGRETIIKAQEAETEDARRTYQIGEISEATGLQKTAQGWKPPKETKFGKVKQNKEGQWGVQTKQGKGSDFLKHKSEKEASRALANYTAGYNTTERSKQDPHSDQARQVKHWDKETEKIKKENRAEGRAAHAAQFQKPAAQEEIGKFYTKFKDAQSAYDAGRQTFTDGGYKIYNTPQGYKVVDDPKIQQRMEAAGYEIEADVPEGTKPPKGPGEKPATPRREAVSAGRMMKDLDGNFWSRPEDFKEDITSRGWDVDEMTNEYAVISNEAGSQYEVRFDDHSDDGDLTVRNFKALQIDEDDDDDSLEDAAPSLSEIVDRVYNIGEISEKTGLQKTANGWRPVKKGAAGKTSRADKEAAIRKDLGLRGENDLDRFTDEQIEKMYAKTQQTPEQQKADFDKSKIGQAVNKGRQEFAAEKTRQKELASKTNAIGLPKESKPGAGIPTYKESDFIGKTYGDFAKALPRGQYTITRNQENPDGSSENDFTDIKHGGKKITVKFDKEGKITSVKQHENPTRSYEVGANNQATETKPAEVSPSDIATNLDEITSSKGGTKNIGGVKVTYVPGNGYRVTHKAPTGRELTTGYDSIEEAQQAVMFRLNRIKKGEIPAIEDAAPRVLTGDCRIRIRKEKPALTGDTRIRVRK